MARPGQAPRLLVREVLLAKDGVDYGVSPKGHGRLSATFINRAIVRARNERLVYLHVHNHGSDRSVEFSDVDYASHSRGYPALLDIANGMPVGALVFGKRVLAANLDFGVGDLPAVLGAHQSAVVPSDVPFIAAG